MSYVELEGLQKTFGRHRALQGVDLAIDEGEFVSLLGSSGCGKTTTLRIVAGFEQPDRGDVRIAGASVLGRRPDKRGVGIVFQSYALFQHMTVLDNVAFGVRAQGGAKRKRASVLTRCSAWLSSKEWEVAALTSFPEVNGRESRWRGPSP